MGIEAPFLLVEDKDIAKAIEFAQDAHAGQVRKFSGKAYIKHPYSVYKRVKKFGVTDKNTLIASILHDVIEDTKVTYKETSDKFGKEVADIVDWLSIKGGKASYIKKMMKNAPQEAIIIKTFDRIDNLNDGGSKDWQKKYKLTTDIIRSGLKKRGFDDLHDQLIKTYKPIYGNPEEAKKEEKPKEKKETKPYKQKSEDELRQEQMEKMGLEHRGKGRYYDKNDNLYHWMGKRFKKIISIGPYKVQESKYRDEGGRPSAANRGYGHGWRVFRDEYLEKHPNCTRCGAKSKVVDHKTSMAKGGAKKDKKNLQALCQKCHNIKSAGKDDKRKAWSGQKANKTTRKYEVK